MFPIWNAGQKKVKIMWLIEFCCLFKAYKIITNNAALFVIFYDLCIEEFNLFHREQNKLYAATKTMTIITHNI